MELRDRIKKAREYGKLSQPALAKFVGVSRQAVMQWEDGTTKSLDAENLVRAARATGVDSFWLATGEGQMVNLYVHETIPDIPLELSQAWRHLDQGLRTHIIAIVQELVKRR